MASSFATMDMSDDFAMPVTAPASASKPVSSTSQRTLLLSPPSLSSHQEKLSSILAMHDRSSTDMQMLDRLSMGLVSLPPSTYNSIMILSDADGSRRESQNLINRKVLGLLVTSMKDNATLQSQDNTLGTAEGTEKNEAILAGLTYQAGKGFTKQASTTAAVPLRLNRKPKVNGDINGNGIAKAAGGLNPDDTNVSLPTSNGANGKRKSMDISQDRPKGLPAGVFIDDGLMKNELEDDSDDELIDEDELLAGEDLAAPVRVPRECAPKAKRRRACKDCTCGLAQRLEAEDKAKRDKADQGLKALKLQADDLAEVDFTVPGKVGSCGNCSLGDAFRCDGCPYIGLPAFKPGEEVRLLNNDIQL